MNHNYKGEYVIFNDVYIDGGEQIIFAILLMRSGNGASQRFKEYGRHHCDQDSGIVGG